MNDLKLNSISHNKKTRMPFGFCGVKFIGVKIPLSYSSLNKNLLIVDLRVKPSL